MEALIHQYPWLDELLMGFIGLSWKHVVMWAVGALLIYLAVKHDYEPTLLLPIGFGAVLANIPHSSAVSNAPGEQGFLIVLYNAGIANELFPVLIFIAIGAMCDFTPLIRRPSVMLFAAAAQFGIFATAIGATLVGFSFEHAASIGIIGAADGPTTIYVASRFAQELLGPLSVAAYCYMSLVPVIQPPVIRAITTESERKMKMGFEGEEPVSQTTKFLFPIMIVLIAGIVAPISVALIGSLMFGNLLKESGVVENLSNSAQNELANLVTLVLGITIGGTMSAERFLTFDVLLIMALGAVAFVFDTVGGVLFAKLLNLISPTKINPMIGACGISAFPMSGRVIAKMALKEDPTNFIIQHAIGVNVAGQVASVVAGGLVLALIPALAK
ncbi:sodium ion-translocating decarboxylase subunit beta [Sporomusa sphaeroides]|uniref:Glutaconyl-CoA decarboxylase subunit beta n=1 Tax=Sporomusa sphaeroides DSM 2875 TaxID=1337886 RepID=A0ABP2CC85_9FIRM|nr:sodium ion-translocating decarboxylase subunit beta [Sporomusa sphaeroides]MCM0758265.1 sodium ion-translocating decarboxylase subunit beta [Sporomusa sphaeroides DSM 2875]OLS57891.1 glutaconyl-CoA decarboxylase subunit beta [Sporomusa sphaeroides DSM 2875]CVK20404.1 Glutaconyl-CoA decarboxylase subunit beta [Sporomusa sphaeroides DSM 2875]